MIASRLKTLVPRARRLGPYMLVELLLPGGTLLALLLWLSQELIRSPRTRAPRRITAATVAERMVGPREPLALLCEECPT